MIKLNGNIVEFKHFNDTTIRVMIPIPQDHYAEVTWLFNDCSEILEILYMLSHLKAHKCYIKLIAPYWPEARQDSAKADKDCFTLKYLCNFINNIDINEIEIYDVHSPVTTALLNNVKIITPKETLQYLINNILPSDVLIAYPDSGSEHRYSSLLRIPYIVGVKERDWESGMVRSLQILGARHMISGHSFLMVDDIVSRGSTLFLAAQQLKELGAENIYVYTSHTENTVLGPHIGKKSLLDIPNLITKLYTTNSIFTGQHEKIEIIKRW